ncbi:serine/arginine-rich splicing factor RS2Z32-like [Drosophila rhopaloa]|uniref:CCHC-type domain-containing protein n=1 Tax=Drosophila rhopaloa TaxID=1041015 RepID=A0ABM5J395_DRORH|nr:serine/arginine-rich splicing factor RS2Z32-like [Drosophila rhopaloa]
MDVMTVDQLREECCEVERNFGRRGRAAYAHPMRYHPAEKARVCEAAGPDTAEDSQWQVEALQAKTRNPFRAGCWNCGAVDHGFRDCTATERRLFCYRCGRPDTVSPKCPDCAENGRLGDPRAGGMRPDKSPAKKYLEARNRIFSNHQLSGMRLVSRKVQKARDRFRKRRARRLKWLPL